MKLYIAIRQKAARGTLHQSKSHTNNKTCKIQAKYTKTKKKQQPINHHYNTFNDIPKVYTPDHVIYKYFHRGKSSVFI